MPATTLAQSAVNHPAPPPDLLVVGGVARGGTEMLSALLNSHHQIHLMSRELRALRYCNLATWAHLAAVHQAFLNPLNRVRDQRFRRQVYRYLWAIMRGHRLSEQTTLDRIHGALASALADGSTRYVGDKYPDYAFLYPQYIHRRNTRCIFIYRDARDVVASLLARLRRGDWRQRGWARQFDTIPKATEYWLAVMNVLQDLTRLESNALVIRYEDLVLETQQTVGTIAGHLEVAAAGFDSGIPTSSSIGRYRGRLTPDEIQTVERLAGPMMATWGYL